jgi:hypothetical protein
MHEFRLVAVKQEREGNLLVHGTYSINTSYDLRFCWNGDLKKMVGAR